jgi:hypothetical protein
MQVALGPAGLPASEGLLSGPKSEGGFQFSGTVNSKCSGTLSKPPSGISSSTYAMGGVRGFSFLRRVAIAMAFSKFCFRCRRDSAVYHAAPLRGFPRALGMVEVWWMPECFPERSLGSQALTVSLDAAPVPAN